MKKDIFIPMYLEERKHLTKDEFMALYDMRVAAGNNKVIWHSKSSLQKICGMGENKTERILKSLESKGAIIIINMREAKTKQKCSNSYYICDYNPITKKYEMDFELLELVQYVVNLRMEKERSYALANNLIPREYDATISLKPYHEIHGIGSVTIESKENSVLEQEKDTKKPCHKIHGMDTQPSSSIDNKETEVVLDVKKPYHEIHGIINNIKEINKINSINNNKRDVVVEEVKVLLQDKLNMDFTDATISTIIRTLNARYDSNIIEPLREKLDLVRSANGISNVVGFLINSIRFNYQPKKTYISNSNTDKNTLRFNNFDQRTYDYDELEKKLLGWE